MGGGGLVILKHKSWHVYNESNREKVRKDEEKAKAEDDEKKARAVKADQEHRLNILRSKAAAGSIREFDNNNSKRKLEDDRDNDCDASRSNRKTKKAQGDTHQTAGTEGVHLNLFGDLESGKSIKRQDGTNVEHESEKALERAKFEKQFTMYLGKDSNSVAGNDAAAPWYAVDKKKESEKKMTEIGRIFIRHLNRLNPTSARSSFSATPGARTNSNTALALTAAKLPAPTAITISPVIKSSNNRAKNSNHRSNSNNFATQDRASFSTAISKEIQPPNIAIAEIKNSDDQQNKNTDQKIATSIVSPNEFSLALSSAIASEGKPEISNSNEFPTLTLSSDCICSSSEKITLKINSIQTKTTTIPASELNNVTKNIYLSNRPSSRQSSVFPSTFSSMRQPSTLYNFRNTAANTPSRYSYRPFRTSTTPFPTPSTAAKRVRIASTPNPDTPFRKLQSSELEALHTFLQCRGEYNIPRELLSRAFYIPQEISKPPINIAHTLRSHGLSRFIKKPARMLVSDSDASDNDDDNIMATNAVAATKYSSARKTPRGVGILPVHKVAVFPKSIHPMPLDDDDEVTSFARTNSWWTRSEYHNLRSGWEIRKMQRVRELLEAEQAKRIVKEPFNSFVKARAVTPTKNTKCASSNGENSGFYGKINSVGGEQSVGSLSNWFPTQ
ncbi:hypothetical protein HK100_001171, partial [Physocladia obscura]